MGKDLLAEKIINDLEVFCVNDKYCKWKDKLELLPRHVKVCEFKDQNLTDWLQGFNNFTSKCTDNQSQSFAMLHNEHLQERINNELPKAPLLARLYTKDSSSKALFGDFVSSKPIIEKNESNPKSKDNAYDILEGILNNDEEDYFKKNFGSSEIKKNDEIVLPKDEIALIKEEKALPLPEMEMMRIMLIDTPQGKNADILNEKDSEEENKKNDQNTNLNKNDENVNPLNIKLKEDKEDKEGDEGVCVEVELMKKRKCKEPLLVLKLKQMKS